MAYESIADVQDPLSRQVVFHNGKRQNKTLRRQIQNSSYHQDAASEGTQSDGVLIDSAFFRSTSHRYGIQTQ